MFRFMRAQGNRDTLFNLDDTGPDNLAILIQTCVQPSFKQFNVFLNAQFNKKCQKSFVEKKSTPC